MEFAKKRILVVGLGRSGLSAARWLSREGAQVTITDIKVEKALDNEILNSALALGTKLETGIHREETFLSSDMIILSPGVPHDIAPLKLATEAGIPVLGEMELAARLIHIPIVAVTGTNGKSTTTALLGCILKRAGLRTFVGGNIGIPLMDYVFGDWEADFAVVEVSSFQLDTMDRFCPTVALLLNISPDHLDRYPDYEAYVQSKLKIFKNQGSGQYAILNDDDERLSQFFPSGEVSVLRYGLTKKENRQAYLQGEKLVAVLNSRKRYQFDIKRFGLPGRHNIENLMSVVLAALALGIEPAFVQETIENFQSLPNRLERVGSIKGVDYYNDSKATNVDAASRSIVSFDRPLILIAGGRHKGGDYAPLVKAAEGRVRKAILMGEAKFLLARSFEGIIPFTFADDMEDAVYQAFSSAESNDVVLLAPACSSFDMFSDYAHRGQIFREMVERLDNGG